MLVKSVAMASGGDGRRPGCIVHWCIECSEQWPAPRTPRPSHPTLRYINSLFSNNPYIDIALKISKLVLTSTYNVHEASSNDADHLIWVCYLGMVWLNVFNKNNECGRTSNKIVDIFSLAFFELPETRPDNCWAWKSPSLCLGAIYYWDRIK